MQLDLVVLLRGRVDALVVVIHGDSQRALSHILADDVLIEVIDDLLRFGNVRQVDGFGLDILLDDLAAKLDALVADVHAGTRDDAVNVLLRLAAKRTAHGGRIFNFCHKLPLSGLSARGKDLVDQSVRARLLGAHVIVPLGIPRDALDALAGALRKDLVEPFLDL